MSVVLDASALLCVLLDEPGADVVMDHMHGAELSSVNLCETLTRVVDEGHDPALGLRLIARSQVEIRPFTADLAVAAARLRSVTRHVGLSLGDRACLALAAARGLPALTADQKWALLDIGIDIRLVR